MKRKKERTTRLPDEINQQLVECVQNLIDDASRFDKGQLRTIKRSSGMLRMLFYDTGMSHSILGQLDDQNKIKMMSCSNPQPDVKLFMGPVYNVRYAVTPIPKSSQDYENTFIFIPDDTTTYVHFQEWWNAPIYFLGDTVFTRKSLTTVMANQDGGAHFDPKIDASYQSLKSGETGYKIKPTIGVALLLGGIVDLNGPDIQFKNITLALMRMVVHETITSLIRYYKLKVDYKPDFSFNRKRITGSMAYHFGLKSDNK